MKKLLLCAALLTGCASVQVEVKHPDNSNIYCNGVSDSSRDMCRASEFNRNFLLYVGASH